MLFYSIVILTVQTIRSTLYTFCTVYLSDDYMNCCDSNSHSVGVVHWWAWCACMCGIDARQALRIWGEGVVFGGGGSYLGGGRSYLGGGGSYLCHLITRCCLQE